MCYTYDNLSRVTARTVKKLSDNSVVSTETFNYDAAGKVTSAPDSSFQYDTNNRLTKFSGNSVSYDLDGNMLSNGTKSFTYDSANRLISADGSTYTYNAEDVRIRQYRYGADTTYVYDTNCKLSKLLCKTTNGIVTKYVYGLGLIGEEKESCFKTYHFDSRGSTVAITNDNSDITDTFAYDTYGKVTSHVGSSFVIFGYNGRDGVVTDANDLIYMRARYYSPKMRRFINADIIPGEISNAITLNRFAYANGNPVSYVDPFGLAVARGNNYDVSVGSNELYSFAKIIANPWNELPNCSIIHKQVQLYLALEYGYCMEYYSHRLKNNINPDTNAKHFYDLYSEESNEFWEVKPISYKTEPGRIRSMEDKMTSYEQDGVVRGHALGKHEIAYGKYTIKIYSESPGKVFYTFSYDDKVKQELPAFIPEKQENQEKNKIEWGQVGEVIGATLPTVITVVGVALCAYFGMPFVLQ